jgi:hypothetical protein
MCYNGLLNRARTLRALKPMLAHQAVLLTRSISVRSPRKSHGITSFADPHPLNPVEPYRYKIRGSGGFFCSSDFRPSNFHRLGPLNPLAATLVDLPASVANKRLTARLNPLDATNYKKHRGGAARLWNSPLTTCNSPLHSSPFLSYPSALFCTTKNSTLLFSIDSALFAQNTRGGGRAILTFYPNSGSANSALPATAACPDRRSRPRRDPVGALSAISVLNPSSSFSFNFELWTYNLVCAALPRITEHGSRVTQSVTHLLFPLDRPTMNSASHLARFRHA